MGLLGLLGFRFELSFEVFYLLKKSESIVVNAVLADAWVYTVLKEKERQTPWCLHLVLIGREWVHEGYYLVDKKK